MIEGLRHGDMVIQQPDERGIRNEMAPSLKLASVLVVENKADHEYALCVLAELTRAERNVKELFAGPKKAAHAAHKAITAAENKLLAPLEDAKQLVSDKCSVYEVAAKSAAAVEAARLSEVASAASGLPMVMHVAPELAEVAGVSTRTLWKAEVTDKVALVQYIAAHPEWIDLVEPYMPGLNALARTARAALNIPGVEAVAETSRAVRI